MSEQSLSLAAADEASRELRELEAIVQRNLNAYLEVWGALLEIKERRLYRRAGYTKFNEYARERWGISDGRARQLARASRQDEQLRADGTPVPVNERQSRALLRCTLPEKRAVGAAVEAEGGYAAVPARRVAELCDEVRGRTVESACPGGAEGPVREWVRATGGKRRWMALLDELLALRSGGEIAKAADRYADVTCPEERGRWLHLLADELEAVAAEARQVADGRPIAFYGSGYMDGLGDDGVAPTITASDGGPLVFIPGTSSSRPPAT